MNQSDTWQYSTRVNPRVTSAEFRGSQHGEASKQCNRNAEIAICNIATYLQPSDQALIWTVDSSQWRGIGDRELKLSKNIDIKNLKS
jgi:hypothetical protein